MNRQSKFNVGKNKKDREFGDIVFDSAVEMKYYRDVILPAMDVGDIVHCERQKKYILQPKFKHNDKTILPIEYKADFFIVFKDGREQVIDIKGCPDSVAKLKRKMFWFIYPNVEYIWIGFSKADGGWVTYETIQEGRKQRRKMKKEISKENKE